VIDLNQINQNQKPNQSHLVWLFFVIYCGLLRLSDADFDATFFMGGVGMSFPAAHGYRSENSCS